MVRFFGAFLPFATRTFRRAARGIAIAALLALGLQGCRESSTSTVRTDHAAPTVLYARQATSAKNLLSNPLNAPAWQQARFAIFEPATKHRHGAGPTEGAAVFGRNNLYVAFVCDARAVFSLPSAKGDGLWRQDCAEVWIDTSKKQNGTNFLEIIATPDGRTYACWHRTASAPKPLADGKPNFGHPFSRIDWPLPGLRVKTARGQWLGRPAWTAVLAIPLAELPRPLHTRPRPGDRWRINLLRYSWVPKHAKQTHRTLYQSNLFPVERACQEFEPYRMGRIVLSPTPGAATAVALSH